MTRRLACLCAFRQLSLGSVGRSRSATDSVGDPARPPDQEPLSHSLSPMMHVLLGDPARPPDQTPWFCWAIPLDTLGSVFRACAGVRRTPVELCRTVELLSNSCRTPDQMFGWAIPLGHLTKRLGAVGRSRSTPWDQCFAHAGVPRTPVELCRTLVELLLISFLHPIRVSCGVLPYAHAGKSSNIHTRSRSLGSRSLPGRWARTISLVP